VVSLIMVDLPVPGRPAITMSLDARECETPLELPGIAQDLLIPNIPWLLLPLALCNTLTLRNLVG
jgi:hypothetical protein